MKRLPPEYAWLSAVQGRPLMIDHALELYGTHEGVGETDDNPIILAWAQEVGLQQVYRHDSVPWCGLFMSVVARRAGKTPPTNPLWALNWAGFGVASPQPSLGDVLVFKRPGGGHVGLYVAEDVQPDTNGVSAYHVLGGNESDQVEIMRIDKGRLYRARRPEYHVQPAGVRRCT